MQQANRSFSFTLNAQSRVAGAVENPAFANQDSEIIYNTLKKGLRVTPFSDYLKRYVYQKSGMFGSFRSISLTTYQATIVEAFRETGTPASLQRSTSRLQTRVREWLQQVTARRNVVLLLGFGLSMSAEDVNMFLTHAIHERKLDPENPLEAICAYCYDHHYGYTKMEQLWKVYENQTGNVLEWESIAAIHPVGREASRAVMEEDYQLMSSLAARKSYLGKTAMQSRGSYHFQRLYQQVCAEISALREAETGEACKIGPHDIEEILYSSIPRNQHGNLIADLGSELRTWLAGKRISRQRLHLLLHDETEPTRYDLMTLRFLCLAVNPEQQEDVKTRYNGYVEDMNHILTDCGFQEIYLADPYESFLLMCVLSSDPLGTYADVIELSYQEGLEGGSSS